MVLSRKPPRTISAQDRQEAIVDDIRHLILSGHLSPGDHLVQAELARRFDVSRTPIREALSRLAQEGLVNLSSFKGASVAKISIDNLIDIYSVRIALESQATFLAALNANEHFIEELSERMEEMGQAFRRKDFEQLFISHNEFHLAIYKTANRPLLFELILRYLGLCHSYQRMSLSIGRGANDPIKEHFDIIQILQFQEAESAASLMRNHLGLTMLELQSRLKEEQINTRAERQLQYP